MYRNILVPTDGSEITAKAVQNAIALAKTTGAKLTALSIKEPFPYSAISEMQTGNCESVNAKRCVYKRNDKC